MPFTAASLGFGTYRFTSEAQSWVAVVVAIAVAPCVVDPYRLLPSLCQRRGWLLSRAACRTLEVAASSARADGAGSPREVGYFGPERLDGWPDHLGDTWNRKNLVEKLV